MNNLKQKLKSVILKLPFGSQLLQLRRKMILLHQAKKREIILRREEKELMKAYKIILKRSKLKQLQKHYNAPQKGNPFSWYQAVCRELLQIKATIRQSEFPIQLKKKLFFEARLRSFRYYYQRSIENLDKFKSYSQLPPEQVTVFEIGTGPALGGTIGMALTGFKKIITVDIRPAEPKHVQLVCEHYKKFATKLGIKRVPKIKGKITSENLNQILLDKFNIDFRTPYDAAHTDLPDDSVGYVYANLVFNFIRAEVLSEIIKEAFRVLHGGGG